MSESEVKQLKNEEILAAMGITLEEAIRVDKELTEKNKKSRSRDSRICVCGHGMGKHNFYAGLVECKPTAMRCPCKKPKPILDTTDTRFFLRKTEGGGILHALSRGIASALAGGHEVNWIEQPSCDKCKTTEGPIQPVPVTQSGVIVDYATGFDAMLCYSCRVSA